MTKKIGIAFGTKKIKKAFEELKEGKFEDKELHKFIETAIKNLKKNPTSGTKIPQKLWSKIYIQKHKITNLWKYNLPNGWRLIYTIKADQLTIISVILEWMNHKNYERKFNY